MATFTLHTPRGLARRAPLATALAVAGLLALAAPGPAGASEARPAPQTLVAAPGQATIHLATPGETVDVLRELELERGKSTHVRSDYRVQRVSVGNPEILDVVVLNPTELQLVAKAIGTTNLLLWDPSGRLQAAIDVHISTAQSQLQAELRRILDTEEIYVENAGHATVLKGSVSSAVAMEQAMTLARAYLGQTAEGRRQGEIVNLLEVGGHQQVMLKVVFAEVSRTVGRQFGTNINALIAYDSHRINLLSMIGGLTSVTSDGSTNEVLLAPAVNALAVFSGYGALEQLAVFLDALDERGIAKVLAEPTLVARSGETANFLVGGEIPIPVVQSGTFGSVTVEFKSFGIGLGFTPTVLGPDRIHLTVSPEVSDVDITSGTEVSGTVVPGFTTRRTTTTVELKDGQSFAIAGLLSDDLRELTARYPLLGNIPILGNLFRSTEYRKNQTELVIIVTPQLVKPLGPGPHSLPTDSFVEPNALEFYLLGKLEGFRSATSQPGGLIGDVGHRVSTTPEGVK